MQTRFAPRNSQRPYVLRGLLVCSACGHTLQGRTQREVAYYTCVYGGQQRPADVAPHTRWLRADVIEPLIWQALVDLLREPQRIARLGLPHRSRRQSVSGKRSANACFSSSGNGCWMPTRPVC